MNPLGILMFDDEKLPFAYGDALRFNAGILWSP